MVPVYTPIDESEAAVISAMLKAYEVPFYIRGGGFSKLYPGMQIKDYNTQTFMVPADQYDFSRELLSEFINPSKDEYAVLPKWSFFRTLRILFEAMFYGWVVSGRRWDKNDK
jgi:hypothetical protein